MKTLKAFALLLLVVPALAPAQKKPKKPVVSAVFAQARYAYVEAVDGNEFDPRVYAEDRDAIVNIENAIRSSGPLRPDHEARSGGPCVCGAQGQALDRPGKRRRQPHSDRGAGRGSKRGTGATPGMGGEPNQQGTLFPRPARPEPGNRSQAGAAKPAPRTICLRFASTMATRTLSMPLWEHQLEDVAWAGRIPSCLRSSRMQWTRHIRARLQASQLGRSRRSRRNMLLAVRGAWGVAKKDAVGRNV